MAHRSLILLAALIAFVISGCVSSNGRHAAAPGTHVAQTAAAETGTSASPLVAARGVDQSVPFTEGGILVPGNQLATAPGELRPVSLPESIDSIDRLYIPGNFQTDFVPRYRTDDGGEVVAVVGPMLNGEISLENAIYVYDRIPGPSRDAAQLLTDNIGGGFLKVMAAEAVANGNLPPGTTWQQLPFAVLNDSGLTTVTGGIAGYPTWCRHATIQTPVWSDGTRQQVTLYGCVAQLASDEWIRIHNRKHGSTIVTEADLEEIRYMLAASLGSDLVAQN